MQTSYRFGQHGAKPGRINAAAEDNDGEIITLAYGDSATIRVTNVGRRRRANPEVHGYMIDVTTGRWLKENEKDEAPEEDGLESADKIKRKQRVIPYVEDRRNILVTRLAHKVGLPTAVTFAIALERGIEAAFQLEDSELSAEGLPDHEERGRALLIESAEGGAGVLRRLVDDPEALNKAARTALQIMHFDPDTGEEDDSAAPGQERCDVPGRGQAQPENLLVSLAANRLDHHGQISKLPLIVWSSMSWAGFSIFGSMTCIYRDVPNEVGRCCSYSPRPAQHRNQSSRPKGDASSASSLPDVHHWLVDHIQR